MGGGRLLLGPTNYNKVNEAIKDRHTVDEKLKCDAALTDVSAQHCLPRRQSPIHPGMPRNLGDSRASLLD